MHARLLLLTALAAAAAAAVTCPDYGALDRTPALPRQTKGKFKRWSSKLIARAFSPVHSLADKLVAAGTDVTMVGRFEYNMLSRKDLAKEYVRAYVYGTGMSGWQLLGRFKTDSSGRVTIPMGKRPVGEYTVAMVVEGDLSSVYGHLTVMERGMQAVLFDIDGTLSKSDMEAALDLIGVRKARPYAYAKDMVLAYKQKGYKIVYLTARPYWFMRESREWLEYMGLPSGHLHLRETGNALASGTEQYKTEYIERLRNTGLDIVRVYGNAVTDIGAYENNNIPKDQTFIIGKYGGERQTQAVRDSYGLHLQQVVTTTPHADCTAK